MNIALPQGVRGRLEAVDAGVAIGWAMAPGLPDLKPLIEILCDGYPVAFDRADIFRPELRASFGGDGCCGFAIALPEAARLFGHGIEAQAANGGAKLAGRISLAQPAHAQRPRLRGEVTRTAGLRVLGWVNPLTFQAAPLRVRAYLGTELLAETMATRQLPQPGDAPLSASARGFDLHLPMDLADGRARQVRVCDADGRELKGSPVTVAAWPAGLGATLQRLAESPDLPPAAASALTRVAALAESGGAGAASVAFREFGAWQRAFPPAAARTDGAGPPMTALIFGPGDAEATRATLPEDATAAALHIPDGVVPAAAWPRHGAVVPVRAGDRLHPAAFGRLAEALKGAQAAYTDTVQMVSGRPHPWMKPDWDPDLCLAQGYVFGLLALRADDAPPKPTLAEWVVAALGDLGGGDVAHVPEALYTQADAAAQGAAPTPPGWAEALREWPAVRRAGGTVSALDGREWLLRPHWPVPRPAPKVAILIPTRDRADLLRRAVETLTAQTRYPAYEIVIVDNGSTCAETLRYLAELRARDIRVLACPGPFNYAALNNRAARETEADFLGLLNNDVEIIDPDWLAEMAGLLARPGTGAVGAKLFWPNGMVQHGGVVLGIDGGAAHAGPGWMAEEPGYCGANLTLRRWSAVTAACLLTRREDYLALGGLDEAAFPVAFNDVDFCLRLGAAGKAVVWTPFARLVHHESASRGRDLLPEKAARARRELAALRERWGGILANDPHYSPNLNREHAPFEGLALPPQRHWDIGLP